MARNPFYSAPKPAPKTVDWQGAEDAIVAYFKQHTDLQAVPDATIRALHPALADDATWTTMQLKLQL